MKRKPTDVNNGKPNLRTGQEQKVQQTNQMSTVTGPKLADQKRKRVEEDVLNTSGKFWYQIPQWIIENKGLDDKPEITFIATRIPKKGDTSAKHRKIGTSGVQRDTVSAQHSGE